MKIQKNMKNMKKRNMKKYWNDCGATLVLNSNIVIQNVLTFK